MQKLVLIPFLLFLSCSIAQENDIDIQFISDRVLIKNVIYPIRISTTNKQKVILIGKGFSITKDEKIFNIKATHSDEYYIDVFQIKKKDSQFVKRINFEVVTMPSPIFVWGDFDPFYDEYVINEDSLRLQKSISLVSGWKDSGKNKWEIIGGELSYNQNYYKLTKEGLNDLIINELINQKGRTKIKFVLTYVGPDGIRRKFIQEKSILIKRNSENKIKTLTIDSILIADPNFQVVNIYANRFRGKDYSDTIKINGGQKTYLRFTAPGTENHYIIYNDAHNEICSIELWPIDKEKLLDFSNYFGKFEIELNGDGGMGKIILIREN